MNDNPIDIHCHYFNGKYAFRELVEISWRWLNGNYPYSRDEIDFLPEKSFLPLELSDLANYVASMFATLVRNPKQNYKHEQQCYLNSQWEPSQPIMTAPLMMDIFFVVDDGESLQEKRMTEELPEGRKRQVFSPTHITSEESKRFSTFAEELKQTVIDAFEQERSKAILESMTPENDSNSVENALDQVIDEFLMPGEEENIAADKKAHKNVQMSRGFRKHLEALRELQEKYPATVLPFLAVDPRRIGIAKLVEEYVREGAFAGVKLYPPLGYLPTHPDLYPIYDYCIEHDIPITAHTSRGGFGTRCQHIHTRSCNQDGETIEIDVDLTKDKNSSVYFAHPKNWLEILNNDNYRNLRLNFAHFGGEEQAVKYADGEPQSENWTGQIIQLMEQFENVYADFSYFPKSEVVDKINAIASRHSIVKERLMFGTDFVMIMKDSKLGGLQNYFDQFTTANIDMLTTNPRKFLGL